MWDSRAGGDSGASEYEYENVLYHGRKRDGLFPVFANHFQGTFKFVHLAVEMIIRVWFQ